MIAEISVECPFCGTRHISQIKTEADLHPKKVLLCHKNYGGCNRFFAVFVTITVETETFGISE